MQGVPEDYCGHQRAEGGRSGNPTTQQFGYDDLTIASQRDIAPVLGNVGAHCNVLWAWIHMSSWWSDVCEFTPSFLETK